MAEALIDDIKNKKELSKSDKEFMNKCIEEGILIKKNNGVKLNV